MKKYLVILLAISLLLVSCTNKEKTKGDIAMEMTKNAIEMHFMDNVKSYDLELSIDENSLIEDFDVYSRDAFVISGTVTSTKGTVMEVDCFIYDLDGTDDLFLMALYADGYFPIINPIPDKYK